LQKNLEEVDPLYFSSTSLPVRPSRFIDFSFHFSEQVNLTISKQKKIMQIQSQLISAANGEAPVDDVATLRIQLSQLQGVSGN